MKYINSILNYPLDKYEKSKIKESKIIKKQNFSVEVL